MIRPYEPRDYADCLYLNQISYSQPSTENELQAKLSGKAWVFEDSPLVIGCIITDAKDERILVWSVTVARNWQRRGIGTQLIRAACKEFPELWLYVDVDSSAKKLYEREGFVVDKFLFNHYGQNSHAYLMRRS